jgi:hypothetical protein
MFVQKDVLLVVCIDCLKGLNLKTKWFLFIFKIKNLNFNKEELIEYLRIEEGFRISHGFCWDCVNKRYPDIELERETFLHRVKYFLKG